MELRDFGKRSGHRVSPLSIGAMRLPRDVDAAVRLLRAAIDSGLRYLDASRGYGECEWLVGLALRDGYREKVLLSSKWSPWAMKIRSDDDASADCVRRRLEESLLRLGVDRLDYYHLWSLSTRDQYDQATAPGGMLEGLLKAKAEGLICHLGITTHDSVENLLVYLEEADWCEALLTTYNLLNVRYAPVIAAAHAKGIGTLVMNPVGGGRLAESSPILMALAKSAGANSVAELAIRYVLSNPAIDTMLNGLNQPSDLADSLAAIERGPFAPDRLALIETRLAGLREQAAAFCTACKYCLPCPAGIDIPGVMGCVADLRFWGFQDRARTRYGEIKGNRADACLKCGKCEQACTQHLPIIREMAFAHANLGTPVGDRAEATAQP